MDLAAVVGNIINTFLPTKIRTDHLDFLKPGSKDLQGLADSVVDRLAPLKIVSFYETEPEHTIRSSTLLSQIIVEKASATLLVPGEEIIPLHSTHRDMCRFPDSDNTEFKRVLNAIQGIAAHAAGGPRTGHRTSRNSFQKSKYTPRLVSPMACILVTILTWRLTSLGRPDKGLCDAVQQI